MGGREGGGINTSSLSSLGMPVTATLSPCRAEQRREANLASVAFSIEFKEPWLAKAQGTRELFAFYKSNAICPHTASCKQTNSKL